MYDVNGNLANNGITLVLVCCFVFIFCVVVLFCVCFLAKLRKRLLVITKVTSVTKILIKKIANVHLRMW